MLVQLAGPGAMRRSVLTRETTRLGRDAELSETARSTAGCSARRVEHGAGPPEPTAVTVSIGLAAWDPERRSAADELLKLADEALYRTKNKSRDRVEPPTASRRRRRAGHRRELKLDRELLLDVEALELDRHRWREIHHQLWP